MSRWAGSVFVSCNGLRAACKKGCQQVIEYPFETHQKLSTWNSVLKKFIAEHRDHEKKK